ncbi:preprotein translocase subunit SecD [Amycolatopsis sulphurea]|uniref:Protein translocase subunit SecD n=1 Tax=Amycolatopsis sulphurea TaxID=76022 RepID=A0A2A9G2G6_9PSEU|nr:protein translocase subunit SecD [Amycolatopsis sulphurea]PFG57052.1 preprotein translocase subunit SecD [Amycolatopsis sulphurea]
MAPSAGHLRPGRYLAFFALIVVALYALVFFTGDGKPTPKLGIDLQGGTRVTLTARTPDGGQPSRDQLNQARQIIETRVNGIGVGGTNVVLDGSNVVITVPGEQGDEAKNLGRTAKLGFRQVITSVPNAPAAPQQGKPAAPGQPGSSTAPSSSPAKPGGGGAAGAPAQQPPGSTPSAPPSSSAAGTGGQTPVEQARKLRQNPDLTSADQAKAQAAQQAALSALVCAPNEPDPLEGNDLPNQPLVACGDKDTTKYVLGPEFLPGTEISDANSGYDQTKGQWMVDLNFKAGGSKTWGDFTSSHVGKQAAFVLDTDVVSAPTIQGAILGGQTQITGQFNQSDAKNLADILKYGSLPLSFDSSDATTVSATLGLASLQAGLIAGAIGLFVVFVYCLFYYRLLGILTIWSLAMSGLLVYATLVLLGRWIGYTLDLAGVAGLIIAIGITADSFVIYFERIKDEIREGRTFRSAVPRGWTRARRTILASDAVSFLAAAILYLIAVGDVQGFAFTLGMSTVLDLVVVYLVTHPLVAIVSTSKSTFLSNTRNLGLGSVQRLSAQRKATRRAAGRTNPKEA